MTRPPDIETPGTLLRPGEAGARAVRGEAGSAALVLSFIAHGTPVGQGNIRHLGKGRPAVHQNAKTLLPWRDTIRHAAIAAISNTYGAWTPPVAPVFPLDQPLRVDVTFTVPKPTGAPKTRRVWPSKRPDLDHMVRACLDAVTHVVMVDDARVVELRAAKRYPLEGVEALTYPGVVVRVYMITGDTA